MAELTLVFDSEKKCLTLSTGSEQAKVTLMVPGFYTYANEKHVFRTTLNEADQLQVAKKIISNL